MHVIEVLSNSIYNLFIYLKHAFREWRKRNSENLSSMLDYAEKKYGRGFVSDVKALKNVTYIFLTLPIFYALYSMWLFSNQQVFRNVIPTIDSFDLYPLSQHQFKDLFK